MVNSADLMIPAGVRDKRAAKGLAIWLYAMCALVALMVTVGGATRLTDSGLSITQWDLIIGTLPPMSEEKWLSEFEKYQQIPEFERVNSSMDLEGFKTIYWWEWGHRNLGRFIGLAYLIPMLWFVFSGAVTSRPLKLQLGGIFLLICGQGAMGWYMVSSGLVDRVDVSQYRLAAHLGLAVIIFGLLFWLAMKFSLKQVGAVPEKGTRQTYRWWTIGIMVAVFAQIILGAFVAGLRAGKTYNTWPLMDGKFFPDGYFVGQADFLHAFETMAAVQFNHRLGAYVLVALAITFWLILRRAGADYGRRALLVTGAVFLQALLGIWTLLAAVPISLGLWHQLGALVVLIAVLFNLFRLTEPAAR
ncbi:MAG: COX15/CtaA family protein [Aquisalinus sp.]|nr:COX15/CtaA family protein [Aquisalinus sp.]